MPRRRGLDSSTVFHVWNRGADRQDIFPVEGDHEYFEQLLADLVDDTGISIHAYALMTNHFHLLVDAPDGQLSTAMHQLGRAYAVRFNRLAIRSGPLFDQRFGSQPILDDDMLMVEGRYIHRNPADIVGLDRLANYRFSSLGVYAGSRPGPDWLSTHLLSAPFADCSTHVDFVVRTHPTDTQYAGRRPPLRRATPDQVDALICDVAQVDQQQLRRAHRGVRNDARLLAVTLTVGWRAATTEQLARRYGFASTRSVRNAASLGRTLLARDAAFIGLHERVAERLPASRS